MLSPCSGPSLLVGDVETALVTGKAAVKGNSESKKGILYLGSDNSKDDAEVR